MDDYFPLIESHYFYLNSSITTTKSSIAKRLGPPAAKPFVKDENELQLDGTKNVFSRLGKEVCSVSFKFY